MIENEQNNPLLPLDESENIVQVVLKDLKVEYSKVTDILSLNTEEFSEKDKFDIIKFSIKVNAVHDYQWEVYRKPSEIKKNFAEIQTELSKANMTPKGEKATLFSNVANWSEDSFQPHILDIQNYYTILFQDSEIYNTLALKEFFNISVESFDKNNNGKKPFEGCILKRAQPQLLRSLIRYMCFPIEYLFFKKYNNRWFVIKDDCIYYMNISISKIKKNIYFFDKGSEVKKEWKDEIWIGIGHRSFTLKFKTIFEREIWYMEITNRINAFKNKSNNI